MSALKNLLGEFQLAYISQRCWEKLCRNRWTVVLAAGFINFFFVTFAGTSDKIFKLNFFIPPCPEIKFLIWGGDCKILSILKIVAGTKIVGNVLLPVKISVLGIFRWWFVSKFSKLFDLYFWIIRISNWKFYFVILIHVILVSFDP